MKVLKELLEKYLSVLAILAWVHLVLFEKQVNTRHVQLHTQTRGGCWNSEAKSKSCCGPGVPSQPWCSGTGILCLSAPFPPSHTKHKRHLAGTSCRPACPSELALNSADPCEYGFQSHYCFPLPVEGRDSPSPNLCTSLSTSFPSGWRCTNAEAPAGSHSIVLNIVFQPSWTGGASKTNPRVYGHAGCAASRGRAGLPAGAGTAWEQGCLMEPGQLLCSGGFVWVCRHCLFSQHADKRGDSAWLPNERGFAPKAFPHSPSSDFRAGLFGIGEPTAPYICIFLLPSEIQESLRPQQKPKPGSVQSPKTP